MASVFCLIIAAIGGHAIAAFIYLAHYGGRRRCLGFVRRCCRTDAPGGSRNEHNDPGNVHCDDVVATEDNKRSE